jgi:hypothetical protein
VNLWQNGRHQKRLVVTDDDVQRLSGQWIKVLADDESFIDEHRRA